jgi:hypothetical protein
MHRHEMQQTYLFIYIYKFYKAFLPCENQSVTPTEKSSCVRTSEDKSAQKRLVLVCGASFLS